jgi:hypothetical protein
MPTPISSPLRACPPGGERLEPALACPVLVEDPGTAGDTGDLIRGEGEALETSSVSLLEEIFN